MKVSFIVVVDKKGAMGCNNRLLWHLPDELKFFKAQTTGKTVIMGRKTFESIGKVLPNRTNIILSKNTNYDVEGCEILNSIPQCEVFLERSGRDKEVFVIGGESIFKQTFEYAERILITVVDDIYEGADTYFPNFDIIFKKNENWNKPKMLLNHGVDEKHPFSFKTYEILRDKRKSSKSKSSVDQFSLVLA
ncbi:dihydrofolate reductase [Dyadobacter sp. LHD-138]|uniref:dihydrofolate reductase n=1 Tax=Dyadobacter sp. LHD-138 TaxID=3071413 RepID=UPI0027E07CA0|nr:dihydrofolate reductase [Dyadobacter sp. LHD-138]MDQ6478341.1 dihydrofolate reductase [Dyadobacter sp. LHD-138]